MTAGLCKGCFADLATGEECPNCASDGSLIPEHGDVLVPGVVLGRKLAVGRLLGRGGFGATYLAWDTNLRVRVAIKEFLPRQLAARDPGETRVHPYSGNLDAFQTGLDQFLGEARNLAQFRDHPGIISVLDFFPENGTGYMVMEYLDGSTLDQYIARVGQLDTVVVLRLIVPVADALRACHKVGLIHRDISPDNIFITNDGRVKVLDFGAARFAIGAQSMNLSVILKEGYAPFEQYQRNGRQGAWTDVYALTASLYRLLTGGLPVSAPDRIGGTQLPTPTELGVAMPPGLQALLDRGLALQPEQRYQTVDAFLADLQGVLRESGASANVTAVRPGARRRLIGGLLGGVVLVGGAAAAAVLFHPQQLLGITQQATQAPMTSIPDLVPTPPPPGDKTTEVVAMSPPALAQPGVIGANPIEFARGLVKQAAQYQIQVRLDLTQRRGAFNSLN